MEPHSTQDVTKGATWILDDKYKTADLQSIIRDNYKQLSADQQKMLLQLFKKYETLIDGILGDGKTTPVSLQLREGVSPYHGQAFPVPKIHKDTIIKEGERLCKLGVFVPGQLALPMLSGRKHLRKKEMVWILIIEKL
jgi:hypothetical protein